MKVFLVLPVILAFASQVRCGILSGPQSYLPPPKPSSEYRVDSGSFRGYTSSGQSVGSLYKSESNQGWTRLRLDQSANQGLASNELSQKSWNYAESSPIQEIPNESNGIAGVSGVYSSLSGLSGFNSAITPENGPRPINTATEGYTYSQRTEARRLPGPQSYQVPVNRPVTAPVAVPRPVEVPRPVRIEVPQQERVKGIRPYLVPESRPYPQTSTVNGYYNVPQPSFVGIPRPYIVVVEKPYPVNVQVPVNVQSQYNSVPNGLNSISTQSDSVPRQSNSGSIGDNSELSNGIINGLAYNRFYGSGLATAVSSVEKSQSDEQASGLSGGYPENGLNVQSSHEYATGQVQSSVTENGSSQSDNVTQDPLYGINGGYRY